MDDESHVFTSKTDDCNIADKSDLKFLDILLLGKTGNGKSALGNSILMRRAFKQSRNMTSETSEVNFEYSKYKNRHIKVVDLPGVCDTRVTSKESLSCVVEKLSDAIIINPEGYHVFLLVVRYGVKFTDEDVHAVSMLKKMFGETFLKKFCVLILTCGDVFQMDNEEASISFHDWCSRQTGCFSKIKKECNDRVVLFNNYTKDQSEKERQLDELIAVVDQLTLGGRRYTNHYFEKARKSRERFLVESTMPVIEEKIIRETSLIVQELGTILNLLPAEQLSILKELLKRILQLADEVSTQDKGTGAFDKMKEILEGFRNTVNTEMKICQRVIQEREKSDEDKEQLRLLLVLDARKLQMFEERERRGYELYVKEMKASHEEFKNFIKMYEQEKRQLVSQGRKERYDNSFCHIL